MADNKLEHKEMVSFVVSTARMYMQTHPWASEVEVSGYVRVILNLMGRQDMIEECDIRGIVERVVKNG